jgi:2-oxoglutarate dehydrogenase E2 component (dihydrolipoamide succinyltransferase)
MSGEVRVPALGESVVSATIANWLKQEGDSVNQGEALVELETDKVNMEVSAELSGVLQKIEKQVGDEVGVGDVLAFIGDAASSQPAATAQEATPVATQEISGDGASQAAQQPTTTAPAEQDNRAVTRLARRIAADNNVDISQVPGNSPRGRVTKDDVISYMEKVAQPPTSQPPQAQPSPQTLQAPTPTPVQAQSNGGAPATEPAPSKAAPPVSPSSPPALKLAASVESGNGRREERVRLSRRRQTIAQRLVEAQHTAAMLTTFNEVDMSAIMEVRARRKESFKERHNVSLGFMSFFTKAVVGALKAYPRLNAEIQGNEMILKHYYDIGIAVSTDEGLVVPVLRDADRKSFAEIEQEIADLAKRARDNSLTLPELQGGTFTITNGGVFGSLLSTPILNGPQVGILGMHKIEQRPVVVDGQIAIRPMMYLAVSYDHRIVDGSESVRFLVRIKELLEDPETLLLEG